MNTDSKVKRFVLSVPKVLALTDFQFQVYRISKVLKRAEKSEIVRELSFRIPELPRKQLWRQVQPYLVPIENKMFQISI